MNVDAFAKLDAKLEFDEDVYQLQFSLQDYPYKEAGVRLSSIKSMFQQIQGINTQTAVQISDNRYAVYYDTLVEGTTYYYQIYVIDPVSAKTVYSDIYSFTTSK